MKKACPFCSRKAIERRVVYGNKNVQAFLTNRPIVPGHVLVTPVRHVVSFENLHAQERRALFVMIFRLKKALKKEFKAQGFNIAWNEGKLAGQSVPHLHVHILPRSVGDTGITTYEPRKFLYRPGSREKSSESELSAVATSIRLLLK